jgi:hypothetical protein
MMIFKNEDEKNLRVHETEQENPTFYLLSKTTAEKNHLAHLSVH